MSGIVGALLPVPRGTVWASRGCAAHAADVIAHISRPRDLDRARNKESKRGSHPTYVGTAEGTWAVSAVFITSTVFCF